MSISNCTISTQRRKLLGYACSFITFSPNYQNVEALAKLVAEDKLVEPCQLLIRLHPNHFLNDPLFAGEREKIRQLAKDLPNVHVVEPVPLGGELGYYSGEDMPEKTSMMAYSDVFLTVYSTMVVEAAIHDRPIISMCIDAPGGWNRKDHFSLALSEIGEWPTHQRFRIAGAGRVIFNPDQLKEAIDEYLRNPENGSENRRRFIQDEVTFTDGKAGQRTGEFLVSLVNGNLEYEGGSMKFLIAGLGSIGRRHLRNLISLGEKDIILFRTNHSTLDLDEFSGLETFSDLNAALDQKPDGVIISNPTALHLDVAIPAAKAGCAILMEKPVSHNFEGIDELKKALRIG